MQSCLHKTTDAGAERLDETGAGYTSFCSYEALLACDHLKGEPKHPHAAIPLQAALKTYQQALLVAQTQNDWAKQVKIT
ncbi:MAG TPA: hypothetical protein V6C91_18575, partial [Coleofasciculaceae cyanobacterium]